MVLTFILGFNIYIRYSNSYFSIFVIFQYYAHFTRHSYFLIVVPHIFGLEFLSIRALLPPPPAPFTKGQGGRCPSPPLRPPLSGVPACMLFLTE
jgi:hypothetical protein